MVVGPSLELLPVGGCLVVLENVGSVWRVKVKVLTREGKDAVHETFVLCCHRHHDILEGVFRFTFHRQNRRETIAVVLPKYAVFDSLNAFKQRLQGDYGKRLAPTSFYRWRRIAWLLKIDNMLDVPS